MAFQGGQIVTGHRVVLQDGVDHGEALERLTEIDGQALFALFGVTDLGVAQDVLRQGAQHLFGEIHQIDVIGVGHIELEHGELGVMANGDAFVAEVAVDLVDTLETTDHQTLQIEFRSDTQVHVDVQRIVVGDEGTCGGATGMTLHHGVSTSMKRLSFRNLRNTGHHLVAGHEGLAGLFVGDQVQVTLAAAGFLVGQTLVLSGSGRSALVSRRMVETCTESSPALVRKQGALDADDVPRSHFLNCSL